MVRIAIGFVAAVIVAYLVGAAALSWFDQSSYLGAGGTALSLGDRISWYLSDLWGLAVTVKFYPMLLAVGLFIAFLAANFARLIAPGLRLWWYAGAGAVALVVIVASLKLAMGLAVLPGARSMAGIAGQAVAGLLAGMTYAALSRRRPA